MGLSESRLTSSAAVIKSDTPTTTTTTTTTTMSPTAVKRRDLSKRRGSHMFFYDASKSSVAIFSDVNTLTKKFQTRKIPTAVDSRPVDGYANGGRQTPWSVYDNAPSDEDDGDCTGHPAPPPYEVTLGRTSYVEFCPNSNDENCNYTCHDRCQSQVTSESAANNVFKVNCEASSEISRIDVPEPMDDGGSLLVLDQPRGTELQQMIAKYNSTAAKGYEMELREGSCETFHGFIRVSMNLNRPINVLAGCRPPSIYDVMDGGQQATGHQDGTLTSFYLPRDTVKALHVTSETSTQELVATLLHKFKVADNPRKYCLYEKYCEGVDGSVRGALRRLHKNERPLWLVLCWRLEDAVNRRLVLQENDTGDILWEAFTVPELSNFLKILDREEEEYLNLVRLKYKKIESILRRAMDQFEPYETSTLAKDSDEDDPHADDVIL